MGEAKLRQKLLGSVAKISDPNAQNIQISINRIGDRIMVDFGKNVQWVSFNVEQAIGFSQNLIEQAMGMKVNIHITPLELDAAIQPHQDQLQPQPSDDQGK